MNKDKLNEEMNRVTDIITRKIMEYVIDLQTKEDIKSIASLLVSLKLSERLLNKTRTDIIDTLNSNEDFSWVNETVDEIMPSINSGVFTLKKDDF